MAVLAFKEIRLSTLGRLYVSFPDGMRSTSVPVGAVRAAQDSAISATAADVLHGFPPILAIPKLSRVSLSLRHAKLPNFWVAKSGQSENNDHLP